ncbi:MAG: S24 family peptidase, partial [Desulfatiglandaceae bacterium]
LGEDSRARIAEAVDRRYEECLEIGRFIVENRHKREPGAGFYQHSIEEIFKSQKTHPVDCKPIPLYESDDVSAEPTSNINLAVSEIYDKINHRLIALRAQDDSMWPSIPKGTIAIIDLNNKKFSDNRTFLVKHMVLQKFVIRACRINKLNPQKDEYIALISQNPEYLPEITGAGWKKLVVGKVIMILRNLENL